MLAPMSWDADLEAEEQEQLREHQEIQAPEPPAPEHVPSPLHRLASDVGNHAFTQTIAREGTGILPDGNVHPDVESTIQSTRGSGGSLDAGVQSKFEDTLGDLSDVRVHTDSTADNLNRAVSARAFATGTDVYFAQGEYSPGSAAGDHLIAHELAHVAQQRGAPASGPLTVSQPGDSLEVEADQVADGLN
jgi:Domain of unknown function (DUF4157)